VPEYTTPKNPVASSSPTVNFDRWICQGLRTSSSPSFAIDSAATPTAFLPGGKRGAAGFNVLVATPLAQTAQTGSQQRRTAGHSAAPCKKGAHLLVNCALPVRAATAAWAWWRTSGAFELLLGVNVIAGLSWSPAAFGWPAYRFSGRSMVAAPPSLLPWASKVELRSGLKAALPAVR